MGMINFLVSPWARWMAVFLVLSAGLIWFGHQQYDKGYAAAEAVRTAEIAAMQKRADAATDETRRQASELESYRDAARMLAMETDNEILADGNACVPTPDELQRARKRWASSD